ncbi:MAG: hypothetical protein VR72_19280 [Clostridiaceae bacterium BRH_c20a]|nr:MAG: hypothetical protein VR72_19280 [Clostridiaceae bacterium BRH_c20a]
MFSGPSQTLDLVKLTLRPIKVVNQVLSQEEVDQLFKEWGIEAVLINTGSNCWKVILKSFPSKIYNGLILEKETPLNQVFPALHTNRGKLGVVFENNEPLGVLDPYLLHTTLWQEILHLECEMNTLMDTVNEAVTMIDNENNVIGWNKRAENMYQIPCATIMGKKIGQFFSSLVVTDVVNKKEVRDKYHQPRPENHVLINARPILYQEKTILGSVCSERDITETVNLHNELSKASSQVNLLKSEIKKISGPADAFGKIYGHSKKMLEVIGLAKKVATTNTVVLIRGESGTGKELFAESIHNYSTRRDKPFIVINCGAVTPALFESELFGYQPGAITGTDKKGKPGKFELAHNGTIFLDEIAELQPEMQVKLLRALQTMHFYRVGGSEPVRVDVRVIAATNRNLEQMIEDGSFREDLYYRLNVVALEIPELRNRKEDIPELVYLFTREFCNQHNRNIVQIDSEVMNIFLGYLWPGNIRELRNVIERMVIMAEDDKITEENLPISLKLTKFKKLYYEGSTLDEVADRAEKEVIRQALEGTSGNKAKAAKILGIPRSTLYYKMNKLGIR